MKPRAAAAISSEFTLNESDSGRSGRCSRPAARWRAQTNGRCVVALEEAAEPGRSNAATAHRACELSIEPAACTIRSSEISRTGTSPPPVPARALQTRSPSLGVPLQSTTPPPQGRRRPRTSRAGSVSLGSSTDINALYRLVERAGLPGGRAAPSPRQLSAGCLLTAMAPDASHKAFVQRVPAARGPRPGPREGGWGTRACVSRLLERRDGDVLAYRQAHHQAFAVSVPRQVGRYRAVAWTRRRDSLDSDRPRERSEFRERAQERGLAVSHDACDPDDLPPWPSASRPESVT